MKEYAYKDSGIEWLGEIPEHWRSRKVKRKAFLIYGDNLPQDDRVDGEIDVFGSNGIVGKHNSSNTTGKTIILGRKGSAGALNYSERSSYVIDTAFYVDENSSRCDLKWLYYVLMQLDLTSLEKESPVPGLGRDQVHYKQIPVPPLPEQKAIADYLDTACQKIDRVIELKEMQIEKIERMNNSIITKAVFHGLNSQVPFKDVNEQWLNEIPAHWRLRKLKRIFESMDYGISESTSSEGTYPVLKMGNIVNGEIAYTNIEYVESVSPELILKDKDLLFNRTNSHEQVAKVGLFKEGEMENVTFASYLVRLRCNEFSNPKYLNYALNTDLFLGLARKLAIPSVQQANLNPTRYGNISIPIPPIEEQEAIVEYLDETVSKTKKLKIKVASQIDKLKNYRKSLIHECVTGKKRVFEGEVPVEAEVV